MGPHSPYHESLGESPAMQRLRREIDAVAPLRSTVLISGETGTGKGLVARLLHATSPRAALPFIHVDCAALSPTVVESELFGHERGSFTGAVARRAGRFELAGEGTIFLDEIGDLAPALQAKLLRVLQDREYERIGGGRTLAMTARVIAATHADLPRAVAAGRFRRDLFYRLNVVHLRVPPLRERKGDLPRLVAAGLERIAESLGVRAPQVDEKAIERLAEHAWPGNVRELLNLLERLAVR
ncbi:MAG: sigma-54 dependent transcriptional regulator, partial [Proteobacteria bacterium]|nr:sigma-54 dependent transcriptional regulator [Pseudomonadota bacterium]